MSISPEDLKIIAAGMGYSVGFNSCLGSKHGNPVVNGDELYEPHTNDSQMVEIMTKLRIDIIWMKDKDTVIASLTNFTSDRIRNEGKTLNLAVCRAGVEYFKGRM